MILGISKKHHDLDFSLKCFGLVWLYIPVNNTPSHGDGATALRVLTSIDQYYGEL